MKERPILFSGAMVNAILSGAKTQTRRVVKLNAAGRVQLAGHQWHPDDPEAFNACPYGKVGNRLWVRETWQPFRRRSPEQEAKISAWFAKGDHSKFMDEQDEWSPMPDGEMSAMYAADFGDWAFDVDSDLKPWKPSIFMPRWASRINLEITGVRVERLNGISVEEVIAEGLSSYLREQDACVDLKEQFETLWDKINGKKHPWASNPFVWVIEFKRV